MTIETRDFGKMELDNQQLLEFLSPIYGFEEYTRFVLLSDDETGSGLMWLQSVEKADLCFILLDPEEIGLDYTPEISNEVASLLKIEKNPVLRLLAVIPDDFHDTTVNLKSPIVINPEKRVAAQALLEAEYPIKMRLFKKEEAGGC